MRGNRRHAGGRPRRDGDSGRLPAPPAERHLPARPLHRPALAHPLSPPRPHPTSATGEVIPQETAAAYALDTFDARRRPLLRTALARRTGRPVPAVPEPERPPRPADEFILGVVADADRL